MRSFTTTITLILLFRAFTNATPIASVRRAVQPTPSEDVERRYFCSREQEHIPMFFGKRDIVSSGGIFRREFNNVSYRCVSVEEHKESNGGSNNLPRFLLTRATPPDCSVADTTGNYDAAPAIDDTASGQPGAAPAPGEPGAAPTPGEPGAAPTSGDPGAAGAPTNGADAGADNGSAAPDPNTSANGGAPATTPATDGSVPAGSTTTDAAPCTDGTLVNGDMSAIASNGDVVGMCMSSDDTTVTP